MENKTFTIYRCAKCAALDIRIQAPGGVCFHCDPFYTCRQCGLQKHSVALQSGICRSCDPETHLLEQEGWFDHCETGNTNCCCEELDF